MADKMIDDIERAKFVLDDRSRRLGEGPIFVVAWLIFRHRILHRRAQAAESDAIFWKDALVEEQRRAEYWKKMYADATYLSRNPHRAKVIRPDPEPSILERLISFVVGW